MQNVGVFNDRATTVILDDYGDTVVQPWVAIERSHEQIGTSALSQKNHVHYVPGIGWQISTYQSQKADSQQLTAAQSGNLSAAAGMLAIGAGVKEFNSFSQEGVTGVDYAAGVQTAGAKVFQARIPADGDFSTFGLSADQAAYPGANPSENTVGLIRAAKSTFNHEPWDMVTFEFMFPMSSIGSNRFAAAFYFCGPAGDDGAGLRGLGQYEIKVRADGKAMVYERLEDGTWKYRYAFEFTIEQVVANRTYSITVASDSYQDGSGNFRGTRIVFIPKGNWGGSVFVQAGFNYAITELQKMAGTLEKVYNVPRLSDVPTTIAPLRVDLATNMRAIVGVNRHIYRDTGSIQDNVISLDAPITSDEPIYLYWTGIIPSDTSWDVQFEAWLGEGIGWTILTADSILPHHTGRSYWRSFTIPAGPPVRQFRATFLFTSSSPDHLHSPTLQRYALYRSPVYQSSSPVTPITLPIREAPPALWRASLDSIDIRQSEDDPTAESATVVVDDMVGDLSSLRTGSMRPIRVETANSAGDNAVLFRGYVMTANAHYRRSSPGRAYPTELSRKFQLECVGEWARLHEALYPSLKSWGNPNEATGDDWKVTDIVRFMLETVYPASMVDVPDVSLKLFGADPSAYVVEPGSRILDVTRTYAEDYLGAYLIPDPSAGAKGMWRLLQQKHAPYNNLAVFEINHPGVGKLPHVSAAYGTTTVGGQEVQHTYILADTMDARVEPPEGNMVLCLGGGFGDDAGKSGMQEGARISQIAVKTDSFNFLNLPPDHANYPDGTSPEYHPWVAMIKVVDQKLATQQAVDWKTRRVFDKACWARGYLSFEAPMILVWDSQDALQSRPRPLRYYDAVQVRDYDGSLIQYLVMSCNPSYRKDNVQMAKYVLVQQGNINQVGVMPTPMTGIQRLLMNLQAKMQGTGKYSPRQFSNQARAVSSLSTIMGLGEPVSKPIQDLDPDSSTFGQFFEMLDYAPIG